MLSSEAVLSSQTKTRGCKSPCATVPICDLTQRNQEGTKALRCKDSYTALLLLEHTLTISAYTGGANLAYIDWGDNENQV